MAKVKSALVKRLKQQQKSMSGGLFIDNKSFTKARLRIIPMGDVLPATEVLQVFAKSRNYGIVSLRTYDLPCPVMDAIDDALTEFDKEDAKVLKEQYNISREYWMGVIDRSDPGTDQKPAIRVFKAKKTVYEPIIKYMVDEDDGEDITDPVQGRDIRVRKEGSGRDTEWTVMFLDLSPI